MLCGAMDLGGKGGLKPPVTGQPNRGGLELALINEAPTLWAEHHLLPGDGVTVRVANQRSSRQRNQEGAIFMRFFKTHFFRALSSGAPIPGGRMPVRPETSARGYAHCLSMLEGV